MNKANRTTQNPLSSLLFAEGVSTTVTLVADIALPVIAITRLDASALEVGWLGAASMGAPLVFGLSAGVLVNRLHLKHVFAFVGTLRVAVLLAVSLAGFIIGVNIYELCIAGFLLSCAKLITDTAMAVAVPSVIAKNRLASANSRIEMVNSFAQAIGPAICGTLLRLVSLENIFLFGAFSSAASATALSRTVAQLESIDDGESRTHIQEVLYGMKLLWRNGFQRAIAVSAGLFNLFHTAFFTVFTLFAFRSLSFTASSFGLLLSLIGLVGVAGGYFASKIVDRLGAKLALIGTLACIGPLGVPVLFLDSTQPIFRIAVIAICLGAWDFAVVVHLIIEATIRQLTVPVNQLSRIAATTRFVSWGADPVGAALGGLLASSALGYRGALACCLLGMSLAGLSLVISKSVRSIDNDVMCFQPD